MLVRSRWRMPPSNRSRSSRVSRSPRNPAYTVAATIAPMLPPHRAPAPSTPPPSAPAPAGPPHVHAPSSNRPLGCRSVPKGSASERDPVDLGHLGGHHLPGVAAGGGGGPPPPGGPAGPGVGR